MREKVLIRLHFLLILYHAAVLASRLESKPLEIFELISVSISLKLPSQAQKALCCLKALKYALKIWYDESDQLMNGCSLGINVQIMGGCVS